MIAAQPYTQKPYKNLDKRAKAKKKIMSYISLIYAIAMEANVVKIHPKYNINFLLKNLINFPIKIRLNYPIKNSKKKFIFIIKLPRK
jgi:hypothetical protein